MGKDNTTFKEKLTLRRLMLRHMEDSPVILETHGGLGYLWAACYSSVQTGIVFEKNSDKAAYLARQRPTWAVYKAICEDAMALGAGAHLMVNVLDADPYGNPWSVIQAFFESERPRAKRLSVVVTDGLLVKIKVGGAWQVQALQPVVQKYGNRGILTNYLDICREMIEEQAAKADYSLTAWTAYQCGHAKQMAHYLAVLER